MTLTTSKEFSFSSADYYSGLDGFDTTVDSFVGLKNALMCKEAVEQLVTRYGLESKRVISIGAGKGFEEYWMVKANCQLTMVDLDSGGAIEQYLESLPKVSQEGSKLLYVIEDSIRYCESIAGKKAFDVLYVSSLHPDEIRREEIQAKFLLERTEVARQSYLTWPKGTRPYSSYVTAGWPLVVDGGLVIMQHYRGGVDVVTRPHYLEDMSDQMMEFGLHLLDVWCFRQSPQHLLVIAVKGGEEHVNHWRTRLKGRRPISIFHGRYPDSLVKNDVIQVTLPKMGGLRVLL